MSNNSFSLADLYPKYIINSRGEKKVFDETKIASVLNKETGLDMNIAENVTEDVLRKIIGLGVDEITTNHLRDLVCVELTQRGMNKYRNLFARAINLESISFKLKDDFIQKFKNKQPEWGPLGYVTYKRTYARLIEGKNRKEEFWETIRRVVEGCYSIQKEHCMKLSLPWNDEKAQKSAEHMFEKIWDFKMSPPGRGLWMMGTEFIARHGSMALNNCFAYETEIITKDGVKKIGDCINTEQEILSRGGKWINAPIREFGEQKLMKITLTRQGKKKIIYATPKHRWFAKSRGNIYRKKGFQEFYTKDLKKYYRLQYVFGQGIKNIKLSPFGIAHGICFGDGCNDHIFLCGEKDKDLLKYFPLNHKIEDNNKCEGGAIKLTELPLYFKEKPSLRETKSYLFGWLAGYFAADGTCKSSGNCVISSSKKENIEFVRDVCVNLGIGCYSIREETRISNLTNKEFTVYSMNLMTDTLTNEFFLLSSHKKNFIRNRQRRYWTVISVESTNRKENVFCPTVPDYHAFTLEGNILTGNCGFASTADIDLKFSKAFEFVMDALMLGVGVGFDTKGAGKIKIKKPQNGNFNFVLSDSREGWVEALKLILESYFFGKQVPNYDFSEIRPAGAPIRGFGGIASGPEPLENMLNEIKQILEKRIDQYITSVEIVDIMNHIGKCVVAGNVRRSAEIALGDPTDFDFVLCKQDKEKLYSHRWASNNSIFAQKGMDYSFLADQIKINGEPGIFWLENAKAYSRMNNKPDYKDKKAAGVNPCVTGDTLIAVADGRVAIPIKQLAEEDADIPVYCKDNNGDTKIRMMRNPRITGYNQVIYKVKLNDGSIIKCTGNHKFYLKDMTKKEAIALCESDSLILNNSLDNHKFRSITKKGYEDVYNGTVDDFHNFGIIIGNDMIFTANCGEQTLESFELCCVSKDTRIQIKEGIPKIGNIIGKEVEVWNGDRWSKVTPFLAGENKDLYRVYLSDGSYLDCTEDHKWHIRPKTARIYRQIETKDLKPGDFSIPFKINSSFDGIYEPNAFEYGVFTGDGYIDKNYPMVIICGDKIKLKELEIKGTWYKPQIKEGYTDPVNRLNLKDIIELNIAKILNDKTSGLPEIIFQWDRDSILEFIAGLIETDGNLSKKINTDNYRIFGTEPLIRDIQLLLRRIGINHSTIYCAGKKGEETNYGIRNYDLFCLYIPTYECGLIPTRIKKAERICSRYKINNAHPNGKKIDSARKQKIVKVEKIEGKHKVFCFSEPENHMGVFGNVLTYQCLVETFPSRHDSYVEYEETLKYAYLYAKSVTLVNTHWKETNAVMLKNRRMGISQTGIIEAFVNHGRRNMLEWCDKGYNYLNQLDEQYSDWLCIPKSIKKTTVKPSGTVSLLPGVPPGIHYPHSEYYIRRIRISKNSDLIEPIRNAGYMIEDDKYSNNSYVIEFPVHEKNFERSKKDVSIWEQAENAADYQKYWSDNQISITITFKPEEAGQIKHVLECYEDKLKSVSFLPIKEHGYEQAPYEEITKEKYEEMKSRVKPLDLDETSDRAIGEQFCDSDKCTVNF